MLTPQQAKRLAAELFDDADESAKGTPPLPPGEGRGEGALPLPLGEGRGEGLPQQIGSYHIRRIIAVGGMGTVYEAEQTHPHRTVALKVMKREYGLRGRRALRRFEYESEILASLRHPGIAQIYEAGTHDDGSGGVPFFVMEYIPGAKPITKYADEHKLSIRQRLELFAEVCDAVHHGHQKGIIHRDLTPGNILVEGIEASRHQGIEECKAATGGHGPASRAVSARVTSAEIQPSAAGVKIIDFGIARATDSDIAVTTMHTDVRELIGTLQYMSPEQCAGDSRDLDIRSDVYSLGVVLYELLCGQLPYDLSHTPIPQATRVIQETDPPRPSTISKRLKGNLEAIVLKALEKDREKRFPSAADLVRNIRNHLAGEPLDIRPPTRFSLAIHWLAHHPIITTAAACLTIAALTLAASSLSVWYLNFRPDHMWLSDDGREARLRSFSDRILHTWRTNAKGGITFAELAKRPQQWGGGQLALIGFSGANENPYPGELTAFDVDNALAEPVWHSGITAEEMIRVFASGGLSSTGFSIHSESTVADVFPDHLGQEVIAVYNHAPSSAAVVRIFDVEGKLLYQIWHDGAITRVHWLSTPGCLLVMASNSEEYWPQRGYHGLRRAHPRIAFGARPRLGHIGERIVTTTPGGDMTTIAFYKCLLPPTQMDLIGFVRFANPLPGEDASRFVRLDLGLLRNPSAAVTWLIDEMGTEVPKSRHTGDAWKLDRDAPDPEIFHLGDLPPIISTPE